MRKEIIMTEKKVKKNDNKSFKIKLIKSPHGRMKAQELSLRGLGLKKLNSMVEVLDTPSNRGLFNAIQHLAIEVK